MRVVVASTNAAKLGAVKRVFTQVWPDMIVTGMEVRMPETIGPMPVGWQVRAGAVYRARQAMAQGVHFAVGAEGGVEFIGDDAYLYNWVAICRSDGALSAAPSEKLRLPPRVSKRIQGGAVLGDLMVEATGRADVNHTDGAVGYYTKGLLTRQQFFEGCLACALAPFLFPEEYDW